MNTEHFQTDDTRIDGMSELMPPQQLLEQYAVSDAASKTVFQSRKVIHEILKDEDDRLLVVVGPCSIHDTEAAMEYSEKLLALRDELKGTLEIVMRVYFEKPRTTVGWKGLINDPDLDNTFDINKGLGIARKLLLDLAEMGMPAGVEYLDLITPQYIADLVSWGAIGARTTESQGHRQLASGLSCPVGFKNGTTGNVQIAVDAVHAASSSHSFLSVTKEGHSAIFRTLGNRDCHLILRGGLTPNYDAAGVDDASVLLEAAGLPTRIMIDSSHANSRKIPTRQLAVTQDIAQQVAMGDRRIMGLMIESNLVEGSQKVVQGQALKHGVSITDACLGWEDTAASLRELAQAVECRSRIV